MRRAGRTAGLLAALNALGALLYLRLASPSWAIAAEDERGIRVTTAEPFLWALGAPPVLLAFVAVDLGWGIALAAGRGVRGSGRVFAAVALVWAAAVASTFRGIDARSGCARTGRCACRPTRR